MKRCKCGSMAFNLTKEGIEQGELCDRHYWQDRAEKTEVLIGRDEYTETLCTEITILESKVAELEKIEQAYTDQVTAHNKTLDVVAQQERLIEQCRDAMETFKDQYPHMVKGYWYDAIAAIAAHRAD